MFLVVFGEFIFQKFVMNPLFGWQFYVVKQDTFYTQYDYEQVNFNKKSRFYIIGRSLRDRKSITYLQLAPKWNLSTRICQSLHFYQHSQTLYDAVQKEIDNLEFVQGVNFEFIDSLENNGTKYLLTLAFLVRRLAIQKPFLILLLLADIVDRVLFTLSATCFIEANLGETLSSRTRTLFLQVSRYVMQVSTLSAHLELGSELVEWYQEATSVPYIHLLIDLSPRTDDGLRYCTNTGSIPSKTSIPEQLKQSKRLDEEHTKSLNSPGVPIIFTQMQKCSPSVMPKRFYPVPLGMHNTIAQWKLAMHQRHHVAQFRSGVRLLSLKCITWKQKRDILASKKSLQLIKVITPPVANHSA